MQEKTYTSRVVEVANRNNGVTAYKLVSGVTRVFTSGEVKKIDIDELKELKGMEGGEYLLQNFLVINDRAALDELDVDTEPEYFYTEKDVRDLLETGTVEQLEDCLNFAPQGVIDMLKQIAVETELPDTRKRKKITQITGFNVDNAIMVRAIMNEESEETDDSAPKRKAAPIVDKTKETTQPTERKYNVVSKKE